MLGTSDSHREVALFFRKIRDWLTLADYGKAKREATRQVVRRYSRGNTSVQNGWFMDEAELESLSRKADDAMKEINRRAAA